jgi:hypothetical protein
LYHGSRERVEVIVTRYRWCQRRMNSTWYSTEAIMQEPKPGVRPFDDAILVALSNQKFSFARPEALTQSRCIAAPPLPEQIEVHRDRMRQMQVKSDK